MASPFAVQSTGFRTASQAAASPWVGRVTQEPVLNRAEKVEQSLMYAAPSVLAGAADTFATSLGLTDDGELEQGLKNTLPQFGDYYGRNREWAQTLGDLGGMFIPGTIAVKGIQRGGAIARAMGANKSRLMSSVFTSGKTRDQLLAAVRARDKFLASKYTKDFMKDPIRRKLARRAQWTRAADIAKETIAFELGVYATMNDSQTLYPDEFTTAELVALNASIPAIFAGLETLATRRLLRASVQDVAERGTRNFREGQLGEVLYKPGRRDAGAVVEGMAIKDIEGIRQGLGTGEEIARENLNRETLALRESLKTQVLNMGKDKPMRNMVSRYNMGDAQVNNVLESQIDDPLTLAGTMSIEKVPATYAESQGLYKAHREIVAKLDEQIADLHKKGDKITGKQKAELDGLIAERDKLGSAEFYVLERDGSLSHAMERRPRVTDGDFPVRTQAESAGSPKRYVGQVGVDQEFNLRGREIAVDADGLLSISGGVDKERIAGLKMPSVAKGGSGNFEMLTPYQRTGVYEVYNKFVDNYVPGERQLIVGGNDHHTRLDAILELHHKWGDQIYGDLRLPAGWSTVDDIAFGSLSSKYKEYDRLMRVNETLLKSPIKTRKPYTYHDMQVMLNLPGTTNGAHHPLLDLFQSFRVQGDTELPAAIRNMEHLRMAVQEQAFFPELQVYVKNVDTLRGGMIRHARKADMPRKPSMLIKRPFDPEMQGRDQFVTELQNLRAQVMQDFNLSEKFGADIVGRTFRVLQGEDEIAKVARQVDQLGEGGQRGTGAVASQEFAAGENPAILAMKHLEGVTDREVREYIGKIFQQYEPVWQTLRKPGNAGHLESANFFVHARRQAWDLEEAAIPATNEAGEAIYQFKLRDTKDNRRRWLDRFGSEMPDDAMMPAPTRSKDYVPVSLSEAAYGAAVAFRDLGAKVLDNTNHIRRLNGQGAVRRKEWWVPPKNFAKEEVVHLVDGAGNYRATIDGRTLSDARAKAMQSIENSPDDMFIVEPKDLQRYLSLQDEAFEKMVDFRDPLAQTGRARGRQVSEVVETGEHVLNDAVQSFNRAFESIIRRTRATYFENEVLYAKKLYNAAGPESAKKGQSIWQQYLASIYGNQTLNPNDLIGRAYYTAESVYDDIVNSLWDRLFRQGTVPVQRDEVGRIIDAPVVNPRDEKRFKEIQKTLGEFNPFSSTTDYMERAFKVSPPVNMKKHMAAINNITTLITLRAFEVGHSILTVASLAATTPAVTKALQPNDIQKASEKGMAAWRAENMAYGTAVDPTTVVYSPVRAAANTMHWIWSKEARSVMDRASARGYFNQNVAESMRALTDPGKNYYQNLIDKYAEIVSFLTDRTERFSRAFSFMHFYKFGKDKLKIADENLLFAFAHRQANENIGNYAPNNRPRMFQGAVGMPLGLFQTFVWNYYQRLFKYVENSQHRALGWQYFAQAAVFGASTVPGYREFTDFFASNYDGTANPAEALERRFGTETAEWFLYGTLSNLPKLLGADDGVALYTRGDVNVRRPPTIFTPQDTPGWQVVSNGLQGMGKTIDMFREQGFSAQRIAEIMSVYSTNRTVKGLTQIGLGYAVDRRGQLIEDDTREGMALAARLAGMRTLKEGRKIEAHGRMRNTQFSQRQRMLRLRDNLRSNIRGGNLDEATINDMVANYIRYGGRPENIPQFLGEQFMASKVDKTLLELLKIVNDPTRGYDVQRALSSLVLPDNDPELSE